MANAPAAPAKTAAEAFAERIPNLQSEIDSVVRRFLEEEKSVAIYDKLEIDGKPLEGHAAVKLWNLKLAAGDALSHDAARVYSEELPDGKRSLPDETLFGCLNRHKIAYQVMRADGSPYLVFPVSAIEIRKSKRADVLQFAANQRT